MRIPEIVGKKLRQARKDIGLSQADLGVVLGGYLDKPWFPQAVSEAEAGRRNFTAEELFALAIVVKRPISYFFLPGTPYKKTFDLPHESFGLYDAKIGEGPLIGFGSVGAALCAEGLAIAESMRQTSREMENRAEALMEISRHLADEGELPPRDEAEAGDELASKRKGGEA